MREVLAQAGYGGIKLVQVYRHIPYFDFHPRRISCTKPINSNRGLVSRSKSEKLRIAGQGEHIDIQLAKLSLLRPNEKLTIYRNLGFYWSLNIGTFKNTLGRSDNYRIRQCGLPFFIYTIKKCLIQLFIL